MWHAYGVSTRERLTRDTKLILFLFNLPFSWRYAFWSTSNNTKRALCRGMQRAVSTRFSTALRLSSNLPGDKEKVNRTVHDDVTLYRTVKYPPVYILSLRVVNPFNRPAGRVRACRRNCTRPHGLHRSTRFGLSRINRSENSN